MSSNSDNGSENNGNSGGILMIDDLIDIPLQASVDIDKGTFTTPQMGMSWLCCSKLTTI